MTYIYDADVVLDEDDGIDADDVLDAIEDCKSILCEDEDEDDGDGEHECTLKNMFMLDITTEVW
jgi:hypothetical protein